MAVQNTKNCANGESSSIPFIDLSFDVNSSESSVLKLVYWIRPKWRECSHELKLTKFTEGITNTLLMVSRHRPGATQSEVDADAILMRAYGNRTDLIIDRNREATSHRLLAERGMAPPLLARFKNGLLYGFIPGRVCKAEDFAREPIWRGVAQKLGEWHAKVPISGISSSHQATNGTNGHINGNVNGNGNVQYHQSLKNGESPDRITMETRRPTPNVWSVMQKWIDALSTQTEKERARKEMLQAEVERSFRALDSEEGVGEHGFVFAHCDLLCANVVQVESLEAAQAQNLQPVTFIDYEYATPAPAAFDIANHFAEWAGYDCDYSMIPTRSVRRQFLQEYLASYGKYANQKFGVPAVDDLYREIDRWRGIPGLYWGIWALIQAKISEIDFDYAKYAEERLGEYFAWRDEVDGTRVRQDRQMPLRERRWAED